MGNTWKSKLFLYTRFHLQFEKRNVAHTSADDKIERFADRLDVTFIINKYFRAAKSLLKSIEMNTDASELKSLKSAVADDSN